MNWILRYVEGISIFVRDIFDVALCCEIDDTVGQYAFSEQFSRNARTSVARATKPTIAAGTHVLRKTRPYSSHLRLKKSQPMFPLGSCFSDCAAMANSYCEMKLQGWILVVVFIKKNIQPSDAYKYLLPTSASHTWNWTFIRNEMIPKELNLTLWPL